MPSSNDRGTLAPSSPLASPSFKSKRKSFARRCERCCCNFIIYFPLVFVYGLTSWAVWVQAYVGVFAAANSAWIGLTSTAVGIILFVLLNWSYTTAVFTDPGSPLTQTTNAYSVIPSDEEEDEEENERELRAQNKLPEPDHTSLTVKSTGGARYCKKCHTRKPDRAHHCSTCRRCVLKMDHHCPWLATCVGFRNYKPFILFLIYTSLFCWHCFAVTGSWVWNEMFGGTAFDESDRLMPVNNILLAVLSGIIGLVLSGFTSWHIYLACTGQTTIESLEKTRYLAPLRKSIQHDPHNPSRNPLTNSMYNNSKTNSAPQNFKSQLLEIHANALPGITRPEEGVSSRPMTPQQHQHTTPNQSNSPAHASLRQNLANTPPPHNARTPTADPNLNSYAAAEAARERARYNAYLDEMDSSKLPNAFDIGWRRNLRHVFGPRPALWALPICNTTGDGWSWEAGKRWLEAREALANEREARMREEAAFARERWETMHGAGRGPPGAARRTPDPSGSDNFEEGDDVPLSRRMEKLQQQRPRPQNWGREGPIGAWNDIPDELLTAPAQGRSSASGRQTLRSCDAPEDSHEA